MITRSKLLEVASYVPENRVLNSDIQSLINQNEKLLAGDVLERIFGIEERRFADPEEQVSDLAVKAAKPILDKHDPKEIDLLIFASASADLIEPATANIVQAKLGLSCPCFDIKNACNSMVSAIQTADAFVKTGTYKNILIVNGEKLSDAINFDIEDEEHLKRTIAAFTLGDAGSAVLVTASTDNSGVYHQAFMTEGKHWELCTIKGGGSLFPRDVSKMFFEGKTAQLRDAILKCAKDFVLKALKNSQWRLESIDHVITHQVSLPSSEKVAEVLGIPRNKFLESFKYFGNTASSSIPLCLSRGIESKRIQKGDRILMVGLAAGLSASVQTMIW